MSTALSRDGRGLAHGVIGWTRVVAFGVSGVAPAGSVVGGLVILVSYAGFASPLVVIIAFVASLCCANSIAEFARRLPSAGSLYTYNSRGLGRIGGFLTGWMMIAAYALYIPAGVALTSAFASLLLAAVVHVTIDPWVLFLVILAAAVLVAYAGIAISSSADLLLAAGEVAVIAALAITILVKTGPVHYSAAVFSPMSSPHGQFNDITNAMIYGISAFAGFEAAAALGEEARDSRRSIPAAVIGVVIVTGVFYLLVTRPVLHDRLSAGAGQRLTVVVGSAGAGKSVLLSSWAAARPPGVTSWLSCDRADANPVRFWTGFIEAPQAVAPWFGADAADLLAVDNAMSPDVTASIANDAAKLPAGSALIVDDFHTAAAAVAEDMTDLVERWPAGTAQLVLASRSDPPLRLHRLPWRSDPSTSRCSSPTSGTSPHR